MLLLIPVIIKELWPVGGQTVRTVGCGNWQRNTGSGSAGPYRVGRRGHLFSSWFQLNNLSCASRLFWTACAVWPGVLHCWWVGGSVVAGRGDADRKIPSSCIITGWLSFPVRLSLGFNVVAYRATSFCQNRNSHYSWFHFPQTVFFFLRALAPFIRKFREYGVWALLCLIKSNCMVPKLLFKHPRHVFHPVAIYRRFGFSQKHLNWNKTGLKQHSKLVVCVGQLGAAHKLLAGKWLSAYRSIPNLVCKIKMRLDNDAADQLPKGTCGPSFYQLP